MSFYFVIIIHGKQEIAYIYSTSIKRSVLQNGHFDFYSRETFLI